MVVYEHARTQMRRGRSHARTRARARLQVLVRQGEADSHMYLVVRGQLRVLVDFSAPSAAADAGPTPDALAAQISGIGIGGEGAGLGQQVG